MNDMSKAQQNMGKNYPLRLSHHHEQHQISPLSISTDSCNSDKNNQYHEQLSEFVDVSEDPTSTLNYVK